MTACLLCGAAGGARVAEGVCVACIGGVPDLSFVLPFEPASKKNSTYVRRTRSGRATIGKRARIHNEEGLIRMFAEQALGRVALPAFSTEDVSVQVVRLVARRQTLVVLRSLGDPPRRARTGRDRDTANLAESICDALQGIAYRNDNQISNLTIRRVL